MTADLVRIELPGAWAAAAPETFPGRALQAWFYGRLAEIDERLAATIHDAAGEKPFHIALLRNTPNDTLVVSGYGPLADPLERLAAHFPRRILLDAHWWEAQGDPACTTARWADLAERLLRVPACTRYRFLFQTPTTFRSGGAYLPLPVPSLVFPSLLERWRSCASIDLGTEATEAAARILLRRHRVQSVAVQLKGHVVAFVGFADFEMRERTGPYAGLLDVLAGFAAFAGIGARVSAGFGSALAAPLPGGAATPAQVSGAPAPGRLANAGLPAHNTSTSLGAVPR